MKKRTLILIVMLITVIALSGCTAKERATYNISREADEFRVVRRVVFYNSITDTYMMEMVGNIAIDIDRDGIMAYTLAIKSLEKEIVKTPLPASEKVGEHYNYICPNDECGKFVDDELHCCDKCGQRLEWE